VLKLWITSRTPVGAGEGDLSDLGDGHALGAEQDHLGSSPGDHRPGPAAQDAQQPITFLVGDVAHPDPFGHHTSRPLVSTNGSLTRQATDIGDRDGAATLLQDARRRFPRLRHGWVDAGYRGAFLDWAREVARVRLQVVARRDGGRQHTWAPAGAPRRVVPRFAVVPRRWVVERSFAWLGRFRRLSRDYEYLTATSEAVIWLATIQLLLRRLARS
jgi:transposase